MLAQSSAGHQTGPSTDLELVNYGRGYAWLRRELADAIRDADRLDRRASRLLGDERVDLTDSGRRALAMAALFDDGWPTVAEASAC